MITFMGVQLEPKPMTKKDDATDLEQRVSDLEKQVAKMSAFEKAVRAMAKQYGLTLPEL